MTICSGAGATTTGWTTTGWATTGWTTTGWANAGDTQLNAAAPSVSLPTADEKIRTDIAVLLKFAPARCRLRATSDQTSGGNVAFRNLRCASVRFRPIADIRRGPILRGFSGRGNSRLA